LIAGLSFFLLQQNRLWLIAVESVFAVSLGWGVALFGRLRASQSFVDQSTQLLDDGEVMTRFREVGNPEIDRMIGVYNRMVDSLREERVRLQEQQHFFGRLLDASPSGVITLDLDGRVASVNPAAAAMFQLDSGEIVGREPGGISAPLAQALSRLDVGGSEVIALRGGRRVRCQRGSFLDRGFQRTFFLLEELTEELRRSEKAAYEKLIRMMSHEVNNSVGAARSLLESSLSYGARLPAEPRAELESALRIANERMERLNAFMRSFADVVRIPEPRLQPCSVEDLLEGVVRLMQAQSALAGVRWEWDRQDPVGVVEVDPVQIEQALLNVLKNAVEAAGEGGTVLVRTGRETSRGFIEIEDSGPGIPEEVRAKLFTPFFTTKPNGQGIGLTMVQEILAKHRFEYSLDGPPGGPTRFRIAFPV
jgi:two-component system nitrogen regulation sensor histidine kinase NtrY